MDEKEEWKYRYCPRCRKRMKKKNYNIYDEDMRLYEYEWECNNQNCQGYIYGEGL